MSELEFVKYDGTQESGELIANIYNRSWPYYPYSALEFRVCDAWIEPVYRYAIYQHGKPIGVVEGHKAAWSGNPTKFSVVVIVDEEYRRRGIGSSALNYIQDILVRKEGMTAMESEVFTHAPAGVAFLEHHGFVRHTVEYIRALDLHEFSVTPNPTPDGFTIITYTQASDQFPAFWRRLYDLHVELEKDVPWHEEVFLEPFDYWLAEHRSAPGFLLNACYLALDEAGNFIATTEIRIKAHEDKYLYTGLTGVVRKFRRRGLARYLKIKSLATATSMRNKDGKEYIVLTENEQGNPMGDINVALGFKKICDLEYFKKNLI